MSGIRWLPKSWRHKSYPLSDEQFRGTLLPELQATFDAPRLVLVKHDFQWQAVHRVVRPKNKRVSE